MFLCFARLFLNHFKKLVFVCFEYFVPNLFLGIFSFLLLFLIEYSCHYIFQLVIFGTSDKIDIFMFSVDIYIPELFLDIVDFWLFLIGSVGNH